MVANTSSSCGKVYRILTPQSGMATKASIEAGVAISWARP